MKKLELEEEERRRRAAVVVKVETVEQQYRKALKFGKCRTMIEFVNKEKFDPDYEDIYGATLLIKAMEFQVYLLWFVFRCCLTSCFSVLSFLLVAVVYVSSPACFACVDLSPCSYIMYSIT